MVENLFRVAEHQSYINGIGNECLYCKKNKSASFQVVQNINLSNCSSFEKLTAQIIYKRLLKRCLIDH